MTEELDDAETYEIRQFASFEPSYANWLMQVAGLCTCLLNVHLLPLLESGGIDPVEDWQNNMRPEHYMAEVLIPHCESEHGATFIDEVIGMEATWGALQP